MRVLKKDLRASAAVSPAEKLDTAPKSEAKHSNLRPAGFSSLAVKGVAQYEITTRWCQTDCSGREGWDRSGYQTAPECD